MLTRKNAKTFEGVGMRAMKAYHKCHIAKTMGIAVVGMVFEDSLENGGTAIKMLFHRAQSAKVAQRLSKDGKAKYHEGRAMSILLIVMLLDLMKELLRIQNFLYYGRTHVRPR